MIRYVAFRKEFDGRLAVENLSLEVERGSVVALLGPNGSGKTTTLKGAAGLVRPTSGAVLLGADGLPAMNPAARRNCSFLPQRVAFPESLTGREVVEFYSRLRGASHDAAARVLKLASLNGSARRRIGSYSGGMVQRLGLAVAMIPDAAILLLDEPTAALDPDGLRALYPVIEERRAAGAAVLFSSHQLGDAERLADRIAVLAAGRLVATMTQRELATRLADRGVMRVRLGRPAADLFERVRAVLPQAMLDGDTVVLRGGAASRPAVLELIRGVGAEITELTTEEGRLDDFYRELVETSP